MSSTDLTTELDAVNLMLSSIGEAPVNSITELEAVSDAGIALSVLRRFTRSILSEGWHFNSDYEYELQPTPNDEIICPNATASVDLSRIEGATWDAVWRDGKLWDRRAKSFTVFTRAVKCDIVWLFPFDELPEKAREYIGTKAAVWFQQDIIGSEKVDQFLVRRALDAERKFKKHESRQADRTIFDAPHMRRTVRR